MITDEAWNEAEAAEIVALSRDGDTGAPTHIVLLDTAEVVALELDKHLARAVAVRLVELAAHLPEPPRILRRASDIDDQLRERDD